MAFLGDPTHPMYQPAGRIGADADDTRTRLIKDLERRAADLPAVFTFDKALFTRAANALRAALSAREARAETLPDATTIDALDRIVVALEDTTLEPGMCDRCYVAHAIAVAERRRIGSASPRPDVPAQQPSDHRPRADDDTARSFDGVKPEPDTPSRQPSGDEPGRMTPGRDVIALLDTLETYGFACRGGPLTLCEDWRRLRAALQA